MHGAKFRQVGLGLLSGAALVVGCSGDDGGGGSSSGNGGNTTATTSPVTTTIGNAANSVGTATSSQSTNSTGSGTASGTSTGTGTAGSTTGTAGSTTGITGSTGSATATAGSTTGSASSTTGSTGSTSGTMGSTTSSTGSTASTTASTSGSTTASTSGSTTASTSGSTTASTSGSTTASTSGSTTGSGGTGGTGCDDPAPPVGGGEGGAAGSDGGDWSGFNFVDESELDEWSILACGSGATNCVDDDAATVSFSCGVLQVEIDWPASANTQATRLQLQNVVPLELLRDLTGKTLYARVRMTSPAVADHGYDFNVIAQDFIDDDDDSNDWKWFSTCYNGSGTCPDNPSGETYTMGTWVPLALPMLADLAPDEFAFDSIRKLAFEIGTKYWAEGEPFGYDDAPATFEIDYVAW